MLNQTTYVLEQTDVSALESILLDENKRLQPVPFDAVRDFSQNDISVFCQKHGVYQIVTTELVEFVRTQIADFRTIEIGAGNGCLGRALGVPLTDNRMQERAHIKRFLAQMKQPPVHYADDVQKLEALTAIKILRAEAAIGSWVTHKWKPGMSDGNQWGVDEAVLSCRLKRYIFVGNFHTHKTKELLRYCTPKEYRFDWLVSRSMHRRENLIWIFDFKN